MRRWLVVLLCVAGLGGRALADDVRQTDTQAAKIHFQAGEQYYKSSHYLEAISEFKEAYRLSQAAALLYNIAQAYDRMCDVAHAREYLQKYIDTGQTDPGELAGLKEKLRGYDRRLADEKAADDARRRATAPPPAPPQTAPAPVAPAPQVIETATPRPYKTWKWIAAGAGVACVVVAGLFAADASKMAKNLEDAAGAQPPATYTGDLPNDYARGDRDSKLAIAFGVAGVGLAATGVIFFILDGRSGTEKVPQARIAPMIGPGTTGAAAVWRF
jgi:tetratricopeptide (TPR) repeat protein